MINAILQAIEESHLGHTVEVMRLAGYIISKVLGQISSNTGAAHVLSLDFPHLAAVLSIGHIRHLVLQVGRGVVSKEVTRQPGGVQVSVRRYYFVIHSPLPEFIVSWYLKSALNSCMGVSQSERVTICSVGYVPYLQHMGNRTLDCLHGHWIEYLLLQRYCVNSLLRPNHITLMPSN